MKKNFSYQSKILFRKKIVKDSQQNTDYKLICILVYLFVIIANTLRIVGINKTKHNNNNERSIIKDLFHLTSLLGVLTGIPATAIILGRIFFRCATSFITLNFERNVVIFDFLVLLEVFLLYLFNILSKKSNENGFV